MKTRKIKKIFINPIKKTTKMSVLRLSAKTIAIASGINVRPNPTIPPAADIRAGFLCGSVNNTGAIDVVIKVNSVTPDTDLEDDILTIQPGTIYNFEPVPGRFYPAIVVTFLSATPQYSTAKCETIFFY